MKRFRPGNRFMSPKGWRKHFHRRRRRRWCHDALSRISCALADVPPGCQARIVSFSNAIPANRKEHLQAYGMVPGYLVRVIQQAPVTVVQIEHTELALESGLAREVQVEDITCG